jgi:hypothetical protein
MLTVITPAASRLLTTVDAAREFLAVGDAVDEQSLLRLIAQASAAVVSHCRRPFARETVSESFRPRGAGPLILSRTPVVGPVAMSLDGAAFLATDLDLDPASGLLHRIGGAGLLACWGGYSATVQYTGGWLLPGQEGRDLPEDVELACLTTMAAQYAGRGRDPMLRSETTEGVGSASFIATADMSALPPQAVSLLEPYRRHVLG